MKLVDNRDEHLIPHERVFFKHGKGNRTVAILGAEPMHRALAKKNMPKVAKFLVEFDAFDMNGNHIKSSNATFTSEEEVVFDSKNMFKEDSSLFEGSILIKTPQVEFDIDSDAKLPKFNEKFNGVLLIYKPEQFMTGVHMYHGVEFRKPSFLVKWYLRNIKLLLKNFLFTLKSFFKRGFPFPAWEMDAVGASVLKSTPNSKAMAVFHNDNFFPGITSYIERRFDQSTFSRKKIPSLPANSTCKFLMNHQKQFDGKWTNLLFPTTPVGVSRFLTGEEFEDGSFCIDHTYFQHSTGTQDTKVTKELRYFDKSVLENDSRLLGPSHPWPLIHNKKTNNLIAFTNQLFPETPKLYDLVVYNEEGEEVLEIKDYLKLTPYGTCTRSVSEELRKIGIEEMSGCYLLKHSVNTPSNELTNRIHGQGIYEFNGKYWNAVQSDASIWSSPTEKVKEIEALSLAKIRRKQYWYAPIICNEELETTIALHNLSYHKDYSENQTLCLRFSTGNKVISEKEVVLKPFGSKFIKVSEFFKDELEKIQPDTAHVVVYPKTGITYCASFIIEDRKSEVFMVEHLLKIPKYKHEISS